LQKPNSIPEKIESSPVPPPAESSKTKKPMVQAPEDSLNRQLNLNPQLGQNNSVQAPQDSLNRQSNLNPQLGQKNSVQAPQNDLKRSISPKGQKTPAKAPRMTLLGALTESSVVPRARRQSDSHAGQNELVQVPQNLPRRQSNPDIRSESGEITDWGPPPRPKLVTYRSDPTRFEIPASDASSVEDDDLEDYNPPVFSTPQVQTASQALASAQLEKFKENRYMAGLQHGYSRLLYLVFVDELKNRKAIKNMDWDVFNQRGWNILAATPTPLLCGVATGNLPQLFFQGDREVNECVQMIYNTEAIRKCPFIYLIALCDSKGEGPTASDWLKIASSLQEYTLHNSRDGRLIELAFAIDCVGHPKHRSKWQKNAKGERRYLKTKDIEDNRPSPMRTKELRKFAQAIKDRATKVPTAQRMTEHLPAYYGGYALNPEGRWYKHKAKPSSYLMASTYAAAEHLFPGKYVLKEFPVSPIVDPDDAPLGEIIISAIAGCMFDTGMGFNIPDPEDILHSITWMNMHERLWVDEWIAEYSPYYANLAEQTRMIEQKIKERKELEEKLASLQERQRQRAKALADKKRELLEVQLFERPKQVALYNIYTTLNVSEFVQQIENSRKHDDLNSQNEDPKDQNEDPEDQIEDPKDQNGDPVDRNTTGPVDQQQNEEGEGVAANLSPVLYGSDDWPKMPISDI
jgi:hypothetical protein